MIKGWDKSTFFQERNRLSDIVDAETNPIRKDYLQMVLEMTDFVYVESLNRYRHPSYNRTQALNNITASVLSSNRYFQVISDYFYSIDEAMNKTDGINSILDKRMRNNTNLNALVNTKTSTDRAISALLKFYRGFDVELYDLFREAYDNSYLNFYRKNNVILPEGSDGRTYYIDGVRKNFVAILNPRDATLVSNLVHEYGHAIKNLITPEACYTNEYDYFAEIPSIFPELISMEENIGQYPRLAMDYLKYDAFVEYYNTSYSLMCQSDIYVQWRNNGYKVNGTMMRKLLKEDGVDKKEFEKALGIDISSNGAYVLSFIVSLELLHIYREDKKEALKLFKKLLQLKPSLSYLGDVTNIIDLNKFAKQETEKIVDDLSISLKGGR